MDHRLKTAPTTTTAALLQGLLLVAALTTALTAIRAEDGEQQSHHARAYALQTELLRCGNLPECAAIHYELATLYLANPQADAHDLELAQRHLEHSLQMGSLTEAEIMHRLLRNQQKETVRRRVFESEVHELRTAVSQLQEELEQMKRIDLERTE